MLQKASDPIDSVEFAERFQNRDPSAFSRVADEMSQPLFAFVLGMVGHRQDAEDVLQEVLCRAARAAASFDSQKGSLRTWLYTIARNACRTAIRRKTKNSYQVLSAEPHSTRDEPSRRIESRETIHRLDQALSELPDPQRAAFVLCEIQQLSLQEAAEIEAAPVGTIKSRVSRARDKLRSVLQNSEVSNHE